MKRRLWLLALAAFCTSLFVPARGQTLETSSPIVLRGASPDLRAAFDAFDNAFDASQAKFPYDNSKGRFGWIESYRLMAYMDMYRATSDTAYLHKLTRRFDRILAKRDDFCSKVDTYTSRALAGWGNASYARNGAPWHVFIVHTGMVTLAPAEFANLVAHTPSLQGVFSTSATLYLKRIEESIVDAQPYWRNGPGPDEGYFVDPGFGLMPLNQSNALGLVMLEVDLATGKQHYRDQVVRLANFMKRRLRKPTPETYDWAYWPKEHEDGSNSEDLSHASINVAFVARCAQAGLVFTREDASRVARTWLKRVRRADGSHGANLAGTGDGSKYLPQAAGRWLCLCPLLAPPLRQEFYRDIDNLFRNSVIITASQSLGIARLFRYKSELVEKR